MVSYSFQVDHFYICLGILIKLGLPPFHHWLIDIVGGGLGKLLVFLILGPQKIPPLTILSVFVPMLESWVWGLYSVMVCGWGFLGMMNQSSVMKLLGYSSISHMGWFLVAQMASFLILVAYVLLYLVVLGNTLVFFDLKVYFKWLDSMKFISLLSYMGFPPFLGFLPKWMVLQEIMFLDFVLLGFLMLLISSLSFYVFFRMLMGFIQMDWPISAWTYKSLGHPSLTLLLTVSTLGSLGGLMFYSLLY